MNTDRLKLFRTEDEVRSYAKVSGFDEGGTNKLVAQWKSATSESKDLIKGSKRYGFIDTNAIETKN